VVSSGRRRLAAGRKKLERKGSSEEVNNRYEGDHELCDPRARVHDCVSSTYTTFFL
ncbi:hypothetical protein Csa_014421, partial [Cucumis sativus]